MIKATISSGMISSTSEEAFSLYEKSSFGEKKSGKIVYSGFEALYLIEKHKMELFLKNKPLSSEKTINLLKKHDKKIELKSIVYEDLRNKGYVLKEALKFGADFRVYDKGERPGLSHAPWLIHTTSTSEKISWHEFASKTRVSHSTKKKLIIAIVDGESSVSYYEIDWKRL